MIAKKSYSPMTISELGSLTALTQGSNMGYCEDGNFTTRQLTPSGKCDQPN